MAAEEGVKVSTELREGQTENEVLRFAKDNRADLIVMGATGMSGTGNYLGKTAVTIIKDSECSVMIVH